jgi:general secretion pathway protein D
MSSIVRRASRPHQVASLCACLLSGTLLPFGGVGAHVAVASKNERAGYTLAFVDADARHVIDAVLGDMMGARYTIDPKVSGTITLRTPEPVARFGLVPLLEDALAPIGAVVIANGSSYRVVPKEGARAATTIATSSDRPSAGYSGEVVKLHYASPKEIARLLEEFVGKGVVAGTDPAYNQIIITGSSDERAQALSLIQKFDVDTLAGSTFQLIHLDYVDADALQAELNRIFQPPLDIIGSRVRIIPLPRLHSVLAIATDPADISRIMPWIQRLDAGGASTKRRLYNYSVQNGRARDLAASLQLVLGRGDASTAQQQQPQQNSGQSLPDISSPQGMLTGTTAIGSSIGAQGLEPSQAVGAETPLPGSGTIGSIPSAGQTAQASDVGPRVVPNDSTNSLLIYADGEDYDFIRQALAELDKPVPQVMIEATLAEVTLTKDLQYGVNWAVMSGNSTFTLSNTGNAAPTASFPGFSYGYIGSTVQAVLNTLQSKTNVRVLSAPKLMVLNNQTATLQVGDEVPIVTQQSQSVSAAGAPIVNTVELRDTGVILKVTPRVNDSGLVTLDIAQEVSSVVPTTTSGINSPTIQQRRLTSTIATRSGQMVALGGLIRENVSRQRQGFPGLSQIPIIGGLFGQHTTNGDRTELIILLTPVVTRSPDEAHSALEDLLNRMPAVKLVLDDEIDRAKPPVVRPHAIQH